MIFSYPIPDFLKDRAQGEIYVCVDEQNLEHDLLVKQLRTGQYELWVQLLFSLISPDDIVLDIGANHGQHTFLLSKLAKKVIAFEPEPTIFRYLQAGSVLNRCENVELRNCGLWHRPKHMECVASVANNVKVNLRRLDDVVQFPVHFVKMDAEGAEKFIMRGGSEIFESKPKLVMELSDQCCTGYFGYDVVETVHQVLSFGYDIMYIFISETCSWTEMSIAQFTDYVKRKSSVEAVFLPKDMRLN